ncbi:KxYKxGKxW signal peptide domain-containing protein [Levilactobacillus spicheri]|uniref:Gram-positive cocci surface proteins LPxTG domain-containing protein n=2 Tax=Levilactobacillus spicheri TaxID=216463 RepID=A0ABQ0WP26_9LACO|nr:KxYKxGKxW signal peptide domain-containing protein [Levilactobacillus spicheri]KRL49706.1 hypothetical protein FD37_GL002424 [Levilactobacillus spicheri DSM 15429]GEO66863.1 hypothetical protein LSP04_12820 [Levilactobacillus spicheri]
MKQKAAQMTTSVHYKSYKAGKRWLYATLGVTALGIGLMGPAQANADTAADGSTDAAQGTVSDQPVDTTSQTVTLPVAQTAPAAADAPTQETGNADDESPETTDANTPETNPQETETAGQSTPQPEAEADPTPAAEPAAQAQTTSPAPAVDKDPGATDKVVDTNVDLTAQIKATNDQGTTISQSTDTNNAGVIVNANATDITAVYTMKNLTDNDQTIYSTLLLLPKYYEAASATSQVVVADSFNINELVSSLPAGLQMSFAVENGNYKSYADLLKAYPDFQLADLKQIRLDGTLGANQSVTINVPLTALKKDLYTISGVEKVGAMNIMNNTNGGDLAFRFAEQLPDVAGQYRAVTAVKLNELYESVPNDIQALIPEVKPGDVSYNNLYNPGSPSADHFYTGGYVSVDLAATGIADLVKDHGYSVLLNADGTPQSTYLYQNKADQQGGSDSGPAIVGGDGSAATGTYAPHVYITLRKVLTAKDSTLKVGDQWTDLDNFVAGLDDADAPLTADQVGVQVQDPDGIMQAGKAVRSGDLTVTYSYQVAADYYGKGEPYIVTVTAKVHVDPAADGGNQGGGSTTTPTDPGDNGGSTTTPTDPGDNGGSTVTPTDPDNNGGATTTPTNPGNNGGTTTPSHPTTGGSAADANRPTAQQPGNAPQPAKTVNQVTASQTQRGGAAATATTITARAAGRVTQLAASAGANSAPTSAQATQQSAGMTATTLPQTGERAASVNPLAAGVLLLLTTLGLAGRRKHRNS